MADGDFTFTKEDIVLVLGRAGKRAMSEGKILEALRRRCVVCGRPRVYGSASRCRPCYETPRLTPPGDPQ